MPSGPEQSALVPPGAGQSARAESALDAPEFEERAGPPEREPTFLRIRWWEALQEADSLPVLREATLCKLPPHGNRPQVPRCPGLRADGNAL